MIMIVLRPCKHFKFSMNVCKRKFSLLSIQYIIHIMMQQRFNAMFSYSPILHQKHILLAQKYSNELIF